MARYLNISDYSFIIQNAQLNQLLQIPGLGGAPNNTSPYNNPKLIKAENTAQEEVYSYLAQRWDLKAEFSNTSIWSYTGSYTSGNRVILDYATFSTLSTYPIGSNVIYNGEAYFSLGNGATTSTPDTQPGTWTDLGAQYTIFYANTNGDSQFNSENFYNVGDEVFYVGHNWTCTTQTLVLSNTDALQYVRLENLPAPYIFPNDTKNNNNGQYWADNGTYSVPINTLPTNTSYWTQGDNRSQQLVMFVMDIALYHLCRAIAPMNVPENRKDAYKDALKYMKMASVGDVTLNVPLLQPTQGLKIRFSGDVRRDNTY